MSIRILSVWIYFIFLGVFFHGCTPLPRFTTVKVYAPKKIGELLFIEEGIASYYADEHHGRKTANGEIYNMHDLTAAHPTLPFNTRVKVTNLTNNKSVIVRVNDRGPFKDDRIIDLSFRAAKEIAMIGPGIVKVRLEVLELPDESDDQKNNNLFY